jgi:glucose-1-phosphate cytidylyltransferase
MNDKMPVVILCGGKGTRLSEKTGTMPKPMVRVGDRPIIWHIMKHYAHYGYDEFILALGYRGEKIREYFADFKEEPWKIHLIDTGQDTLTGNRMQRAAPLIAGRTFMMTYGDGVGTVDIDKLLAFHEAHEGLVTLTAVCPPARFGALEFEGDRISHFKEKSVSKGAWINGGFFVIEPEALRWIDGDTMWEHAPMESLADGGELYAYKHEGFWQCMDTLRDLEYLESQWASGSPLWKTW